MASNANVVLIQNFIVSRVVKYSLTRYWPDWYPCTAGFGEHSRALLAPSGTACYLLDASNNILASESGIPVYAGQYNTVGSVTVSIVNGNTIRTDFDLLPGKPAKAGSIRYEW